MESIKIIPKNQHRKNNSFVFKNNNLSCCETTVAQGKKIKCDYETISLKSKNTQSVSTGPDDKKENVLIKSVSNKSINIVYILNRLSKRKKENGIGFVAKIKRKGSTPEKNVNEVIDINKKNTKYKNNENKTSRNKMNIPKKNLTILGKNKNINPKNNNNKIGKIYKEDNSLKKDFQKISKTMLKAIPPKINELFSNKFDFSNVHNNGKNLRNMYKSNVPHVFINHLMILKSNHITNVSKYHKISTTNRIKGKKLTLFYYFPKDQTM